MSNANIRETINLQSIVKYICYSRWKWLGHVYRKRERIIKDMVMYEIQGRPKNVGKEY